ncbi:MAG: TIGR00341 family protein [Bacteroidota bacterium]|nr:TIGR00341 family protein [Bacteroidota bacterium]
MRKYLLNFLNIREDTDYEKTRSTIVEGISLRGYNFWILVCSTILSSIGLDINSGAVIIGGMLISPLMSPILGAGLSLAIHDRQLIRHSFRNLSMSVLISLGASIIYFYLSPLGQPTAELQARTFPTLLDVLVALFGGIAGIVSISRHEQTNAIPGVAIATALMPPICTAGFGIATSNWDYFFGAFYLFFINAVFISLATYLIARYLHFPEKEFTNKKVARQYRVWFIAVSMLALTPSVYFLYTVYKKELNKKDIEEFVINPIKSKGNEILKWEIVKKDSGNLVKVYYSGSQLSDSLKKHIDSSLYENKLQKYEVMPMRVNLTKEEVSALSADMTKQIIEEMHLKEMKEQIILGEKARDTLSLKQLFKEVKIAFPVIDTLSNGWIIYPDASRVVDTIPIVFYKTLKRVSKKETQQLYNYLLVRFAKDTVALIKQ